jgi:hypothetical protein
VRKLVIDFDLTFILPLILLALGVFLNSFRRYWESRSYYRASLKRIEKPFDSPEDEHQFLEWASERCTKWRKDRKLLWLPSIALVVFCALMLMPDGFKIFLAEGLWKLLFMISAVSFVVSIPAAWHYAKGFNWLKFGICLLVMLLAAASAEHFIHQNINARHVNCPRCSDDDDEPDDN